MRMVASIGMTCILLASGAVAQDGDAYAIGDAGNRVPLSAVQLYRAIGDRIVSERDIIGNNTLRWDQIDAALPRTRITLSLLDAGDEAALLATVRRGCMDAGQDAALCATVGLREDKLDRIGDDWQSASLWPGMARFDAQTTASVMPTIAPTIPSRSRTETGASGMTKIITTVLPPPPPPPPAPVVMPAPAPMIEPAAMIMEEGPDRVYASRMFMGRDTFPPEDFAAYGILAFDTSPTSEDRPLYITICEAFFSALVNSDDVEAATNVQMVTVWPVDDRTDDTLTETLNIARANEDSCALAVEFYDTQVAQNAIDDARLAGMSLSGRGPFLLAWSPAEDMGKDDAIVLAADMSGVQTVAEAKDMLRIWRDDIERDTELWESGFTLEKTRVKIRQIVNRYGDGLLRFFGG